MTDLKEVCSVGPKSELDMPLIESGTNTLLGAALAAFTIADCAAA
jgi:hypothetical protein